MNNDLLKDLTIRGDLAVESFRIILEELGLLLAYKDGDLIFADKKTYIEKNEKVSVSTRIGNVNITKFNSIDKVPEHILKVQEKINEAYRENLKNE